MFGGQFFEHKQIAKFILQDNCKNTKPIATLCNNILKEAGINVDQHAIESLPEGRPPSLSRWGLPMVRKLGAIGQILQWKSEGLSYAQMAVLSPWQEKIA